MMSERICSACGFVPLRAGEGNVCEPCVALDRQFSAPRDGLDVPMPGAPPVIHPARNCDRCGKAFEPLGEGRETRTTCAWCIQVPVFSTANGRDQAIVKKACGLLRAMRQPDVEGEREFVTVEWLNPRIDEVLAVLEGKR